MLKNRIFVLSMIVIAGLVMLRPALVAAEHAGSKVNGAAR
jgi:hypothetical protein